MPTPGGSAVPLIPALPAGLAIAALLVLALLAVLATRYRRNTPQSFTLVSTNVPNSVDVPADNRMHLYETTTVNTNNNNNNNDVPRDDDWGLPIDLATVQVVDARGGVMGGGAPAARAGVAAVAVAHPNAAEFVWATDDEHGGDGDSDDDEFLLASDDLRSQ